MRRVLVTGSRGFVGRAFYRHHVDQGDDVLGLDVLNGNHWDCRDFFDRCDDRFDLIIHCAAVVGGRATIDGEPLRLAVNDLSIDASLFAWALRIRKARPHLNPPRIVYFSSSAAYPTYAQRAPGVRLSEYSYLPGECDQTYGWVKQTGERLAAEANAIGIPVHVFRPFSGYGNDQALDYPFPSFIHRAAQHEAPFDIWGRGDSARDWIHIDDIVGAVSAAVTADVRGPVNLCTGRATTFDELAQLAQQAAGYSTCSRYLGDAPQGVFWRVGDPTTMEGFYVPQITIEQGVERAVAALVAT